MREEMDGKVFFLPPVHINVPMMEVLFPICILTGRVNNCLLRLGKNKNRGNASIGAKT